MKKDKAKILIVDDEEINLRIMKAMLAPSDYDIYLARDGQEAIELAETVLPDLILLDINMPGLNRLQLLDQLSTGHLQVESFSKFSFHHKESCDYP